MEIRQMRTFLQIADLGSFTKAAEALGYTQANVSMQIKLLEEELGTVLFDRIGKRISLTQQGKELVPYAKQVVELSLKAEDLFRKPEELRGSIRIGMVESIYEAVAQDALLEYHRRFPLVQINLTVDSTENLKHMLLSSGLDAAYIIDDSLSTSEWKLWDAAKVRIIAAASCGSSLAERSSLQLSDLADTQMILMEQDASYTRHFISELASAGITADPFLLLQSPSLACSMLAGYDSMTVIPEYSAASSIKDGKIKMLDIPGFSQWEYVQLVLNKNKTVTPQIEGMLTVLKENFRKIITD